MKRSLLAADSSSSALLIPTSPSCKTLSLHNPSSRFTPSSFPSPYSNPLSLRIYPSRPSPFLNKRCSFISYLTTDSDAKTEPNRIEVPLESADEFSTEVRTPAVLSNWPLPKFSLSDQASFLLAFIACTTSAAFVGLVAAAVPTLYAMGRAAIAFAKLADTAREELPSTMAAIRLSSMEISDLTLELNDLSQEMADGVNKSAQVVQAAETGIRQIGSRAHQQTMSMIEERANLPDMSFQPFVVGAAKKTSRAVGHATKTLMNMISRGELSSSENEVDRLQV